MFEDYFDLVWIFWKPEGREGGRKGEGFHDMQVGGQNQQNILMAYIEYIFHTRQGEISNTNVHCPDQQIGNRL